MSQYLSEEQQIERIKKFWDNYGNVIVNTAIALIIVVAGWNWWQQHQNKISGNASRIYTQLIESSYRKDNAGIKSFAKRLTEQFPNTIYAQFANFEMAKMDVDKNNYKSALLRLETVSQKAKSPTIKQISDLRRARVHIALQEYDKALTILKTESDPEFNSVISQVRGDIFYAKGEKQKAREQYLIALQHYPIELGGELLLKMKLNNIPKQDNHVAQTQKTGANI